MRPNRAAVQEGFNSRARLKETAARALMPNAN
jgi:hypothetical protein